MSHHSSNHSITHLRTRALTRPAHEALKEVASMENINTMAQTPVSPIQGSNASAFAMFTRTAGMSERGCTFGATAVLRPVDATDLSGTSPVRTRQDVAAKGHVALIAYIPGTHAWSPPIC